jgi:hypothetical protein
MRFPTRHVSSSSPPWLSSSSPLPSSRHRLTQIRSISTRSYLQSLRFRSSVLQFIRFRSLESSNLSISQLNALTPSIAQSVSTD